MCNVHLGHFIFWTLSGDCKSQQHEHKACLRRLTLFNKEHKTDQHLHCEIPDQGEW